MKKTSPKVQKLTLSRETVYKLTSLDLQSVKGGAIPSGCSACGGSSCDPECVTS